MSSLVYTIASTKRKLKEASDYLDEVFKEYQCNIEAKKTELESKYRNFDKDKIILKITQRMVYLNKIYPSFTNEARLDELSKLLDWMEKEC